MHLLKALHDPKHEKYPVYYSMVLIVIVSFIIIMNLNIVEITPIEGSAVFFEGFASLYMLSRHKKTQIDFPSHLAKISKRKLSVF